MSVDSPLMRDVLNGVLNSRVNSSGLFSSFDFTKRTDAEISAGVFPVNYSYEPGYLPRYGTDTSAWNDCVASRGGGTNRMLLPLGTTVLNGTQSRLPNGFTVEGLDQFGSVLSVPGDGSGISTANNPYNTGGFLQVYLRNFTIESNDSTNAGAGIAVGSFTHFEAKRIRVFGFLYGFVIDQTELFLIDKCIVEANLSSAVGVWIVNGNEWNAASGPGWTNVGTVSNCQLSGGFCGIADDGGNAHCFYGNNVDGHSVPVRIAGATSFNLIGNSFETQKETGPANVLITDTGLQGTTKRECRGGTIFDNTFAGDMAAAHSLLTFVATAGELHKGFNVTANTFGSQLGRGGAIDVTYLKNSFCGFNQDEGSGAMHHYIGIHDDSAGNILYPPQLGSAVLADTDGYNFGDTRYPVIAKGGLRAGTSAVTVTGFLAGNKTFDWPSVAVSSNTNTTVTVTGAALGDKVIDCSMSIDIGTKAILTGHVESANTVRVILQNLDTVSALDLASATLSVAVMKVA